jgi:hypothetical protein
MIKHVRSAFAAILVALTIALSAGAFNGFSQVDMAGIKPAPSRVQGSFDLNNGTSTIGLG